MQVLLDIDEYFVSELIVKENPKYKPKKVYEGKTKIAYNIKRKGSDPLFMINMAIQVGNPKNMIEQDPYYTSLKLTGLFRFLKETDENTIAKMIHLNGPSILYGIARGVVAQATSNCVHGKYILPTINFIELTKRKSAKKVLRKKRKKV